MKKILPLIVGLLLAFNAFAARVSALYSTTLPVTSQSSSEREQVLSTGLAEVLIKVSGSQQTLENPKVKLRLKSAGSLLEQYSYQTNSDSTKPFLLQMDFDPKSVNKLLREANIAIWGQNRPLILVWLEYEAPGLPAEIIANDSTNDIANTLKHAAEQRGIPILLPVMDMTDLNQVDVNNIVTMTLPPLMSASKRYTSDAMLIGRVMQTTDGYDSQWKLVLGKDQWDWHFAGRTIADVVTALSNNIATTLAGRFATAISENVQTKLTLKVTGISASEDFSQLLNYITHLAPVADAQVVQVNDSEVILKVSLRSNEQSLNQALQLSQYLTPAASVDNMLVYEWNRK